MCECIGREGGVFDEGFRHAFCRHLTRVVRRQQTIHLRSQTDKRDGLLTGQFVFHLAEHLLIDVRLELTIVVRIIGCVEPGHVVLHNFIQVRTRHVIAERI